MATVASDPISALLQREAVLKAPEFIQQAVIRYQKKFEVYGNECYDPRNSWNHNK